jgi:phosphopantetheine attachment domain protein
LREFLKIREFYIRRINDMEYKDKLVELLSDKYGWTEEKIMSAEDFQELGMDSLSVYSLITDIEDMTGFKFETNDITEVSSPMKILEYMDKNFKKD